jgi:hypothetical protein
MWSDWCLELQKIMTLESVFSSRKLVTMVNPFETKMAFLAHISNFITISRWENSWGDPLRTQF